MSEKIQKILANAGLGSRRQLEEWLSAGRIRINDKVAKLGDRATLHDRIVVDGKEIKLAVGIKTRVLLYHKPIGEVVTRNDKEKRPTVFDNLPELKIGRWIAIGRLDINTSGLLLFTNNGELAHRLMHPSSKIEREYAVRVLGEVDGAVLERLQKGVQLEDGIAKFEKIVEGAGSGANRWYYVIIKQGRHRIVRRLWESQGVMVSRLIRVRFDEFILGRRHPLGQWVELGSEDLDQAYQKR